AGAVLGVADQDRVRRGRHLDARGATVAVAAGAPADLDARTAVGAVAARVPDNPVRLRRGHHGPLDPRRARLPGWQSAPSILPRPARSSPALPGCPGRPRSPPVSPRTHTTSRSPGRPPA